jgi:O-antigen ligase
MMTSPIHLGSLQRWTVFGAIAIMAAILWVNTVESGMAKQPVFVLSAALLVALFMTECIIVRKIEITISAIVVLAGLHLSLFILSAVLTYDPLSTISALAFGSSCLIFLITGSRLFETRQHIDRLLTSIEVLTVALCAVAAVQFFLGVSLPIDFHVKTYGRVSSLLGHSTYFSAYLIVVFPLVLGHAIHRNIHGGRTALHFVLLAAIMFFLVASETRSSIAAWVVSMAVFLLLAPMGTRIKKSVLLAGAVCAGGVLYAAVIQPDLGRQLIARLDEGRGSTIARRVYFWTAGRDAFTASPFFGHGIGSYEQTVFTFRNPDYWQAHSEDIVPHAHNELIEIADEFGVVGLLLFGATFFVVIRRGVRIARNTAGAERWKNWIIAAVIGSIAAIAVDNLANISLRQAPVAALVWLLMGLLWSPVLATDRDRIIMVPLPLPKLMLLVPILAWIIFAATYVKSQAGSFVSSTHLLRALEADERNPEGAVREAEAAVAADPGNLLARSYLAEDYANAKEWEKAVQASTELQRLSQFYPKSNLVKAYALLHLGQYHEALSAIDEELKKRSHPEAFLIKASASRMLHDSSGERLALTNLLKKIIEAKSVYPYRAACERLIDLSRKENEKAEVLMLFDSLGAVDPAGREFLEREQEKLHARAVQ